MAMGREFVTSEVFAILRGYMISIRNPVSN